MTALQKQEQANGPRGDRTHGCRRRRFSGRLREDSVFGHHHKTRKYHSGPGSMAPHNRPRFPSSISKQLLLVVELHVRQTLTTSKAAGFSKGEFSSGQSRRYRTGRCSRHRSHPAGRGETTPTGSRAHSCASPRPPALGVISEPSHLSPRLEPEALRSAVSDSCRSRHVERSFPERRISSEHGPTFVLWSLSANRFGVVVSVWKQIKNKSHPTRVAIRRATGRTARPVSTRFGSGEPTGHTFYPLNGRAFDGGKDDRSTRSFRRLTGHDALRLPKKYRVRFGESCVTATCRTCAALRRRRHGDDGQTAR
jgi:hypothetical protein